LQTKGLYDRVQELHRNMEDVIGKLNEYKQINNAMIDELRVVKAKYEDDEHKYTEVSKKLVLSERLCKELEDNYNLFKSQTKNINDDIKMIQT